MRYHALACDYDGTIAWDGKVTKQTIEALEEVHRSGRKLVLVTGRELDDLMTVFPRIDLFDRVVAENGGLLYRPASREEKLLGEAPPQKFVEVLEARGVERISVGRVIVATRQPHEIVALDVIRDLGLELQVIFNKGAVMILPSGVNKATGLTAALGELGLSPHNVVGVGDAENDHAFLAACECSVAVSNAIDTVKQRADWVTEESHGSGVEELVRVLLNSDLSELEDRLHSQLVLGRKADGSDFAIRPYGANILITGTSGGGKSTLAKSFLERLADQRYQFVIIDPEGDYSNFKEGVVLGDDEHPPSTQEVLDLISKVDQNTVVNLVGLDIKRRPAFFEALLPRIQEQRAKTGRPHWMVVDEAHHVLPSSWEAVGVTVAQRVYGFMLITLEAKRLSRAVLSAVDLVIAVGENPGEMLTVFAEAIDQGPPRFTPRTPTKGEAVVWAWRSESEPVWFRAAQPRAERRRHQRKYAEGELPPELSFYFRGPEQKLNLRAQNLTVFLQIADGIDDETWMYHLKQGDLSRWFRDVIKDAELTAQAELLEKDEAISAAASRQRIREEIELRYILAE
jgi:HAD superfamily hydrolase (TIGR01484 family)